MRTKEEIVAQLKEDFLVNECGVGSWRSLQPAPSNRWGYDTVSYRYLLHLYDGQHARLLNDVLDGVFDFDPLYSWEVRSCLVASELVTVRLERVMERAEYLVERLIGRLG